MKQEALQIKLDEEEELRKNLKKKGPKKPPARNNRRKKKRKRPQRIKMKKKIKIYLQKEVFILNWLKLIWQL